MLVLITYSLAPCYKTFTSAVLLIMVPRLARSYLKKAKVAKSRNYHSAVNYRRKSCRAQTLAWLEKWPSPKTVGEA